MKKWARPVTASKSYGGFDAASLNDQDVLSILNDEDNALNHYIAVKQMEVTEQVEQYSDSDVYVSVDRVRRGPMGDFLFTLYVHCEYYDDLWEDDSYTVDVVYISETDTIVSKEEYEPRNINIILNGIKSWESGDENLLKREIPLCWDSLPEGYILRIDNSAGSNYRFVKKDGHMIRHQVKMTYREHETRSGVKFTAPDNIIEPPYSVPDEYAQVNIKNAIKWSTTGIYIIDTSGHVVERATRVSRRS